MDYGLFICMLNHFKIDEIDNFEITFVNEHGVEKIIKLDDLI